MAIFGYLEPNYSHYYKAVSELGAFGARNWIAMNIICLFMTGVLAVMAGIAFRKLSIKSGNPRGSDQKMDHLLNSAQSLTIEHRLPLLEVAFPQIKHRPLSELEILLNTIEKMVTVDQHVDTFEYLLFKQLELQVQDKSRPDKAVLHGKKRLSSKKPECIHLMAILAMHGSDNISDAKQAFNQGLINLEWPESELPIVKNWSEKLNVVLTELNLLHPLEKKKLVIAMAKIILSDDKVSIQEHELLRAICASLHIPLPVLA